MLRLEGRAEGGEDGCDGAVGVRRASGVWLAGAGVGGCEERWAGGMWGSCARRSEVWDKVGCYNVEEWGGGMNGSGVRGCAWESGGEEKVVAWLGMTAGGGGGMRTKMHIKRWHRGL